MPRKPRKRPDPPDGGRGPDQVLLRKLEDAGADLERIEKGEAPTPDELARAPRLEFWCVVEDGPFRVLQGVVSGHPHIRDGALVATSPLVVLAENRCWARTLSRFYRLGLSLGEAMTRRH